MKAKTKQTIKNIFLSNVSNQTALNAAKTSPWWIGLIMAIFGILLPIIPLMTTVAKSNGSNIINSVSYGLETYNTSSLLDLEEKGYDLKVDGNNELLIYKDNTPITEIRVTEETVPVSQYISTNDEGIQRVEYEVYFTTRKVSGTNGVSPLIKELNAIKYINGTINRYVDGDEPAEGETYYRPSYLLIYKQGIRLQINKRETTKNISAVAGDFKSTKTGPDDLIAKLLEVDQITLDFTKGTDGHYTILRDEEFTKGVHKNFKAFLDQTYLETKKMSFITYSTVFTGVYALLVVFMGLMIFLLTRGKKNPMNYLTFWVCVKTTMWAALAPGLLAMILGFILSQWATMFFIILFGMRTMWLSMKQLRPDYQR